MIDVIWNLLVSSGNTPLNIPTDAAMVDDKLNLEHIIIRKSSLRTVLDVR